MELCLPDLPRPVVPGEPPAAASAPRPHLLGEVFPAEEPSLRGLRGAATVAAVVTTEGRETDAAAEAGLVEDGTTNAAQERVGDRKMATNARLHRHQDTAKVGPLASAVQIKLIVRSPGVGTALRGRWRATTTTSSLLRESKGDPPAPPSGPMMDPAERSAYQHTGTGQQRQQPEYNGQDVGEIGQEQHQR